MNDISQSEIRVMAVACDAIFGQRPQQHGDTDLLSLLDATSAYIELKDGSTIKRDDKGWVCCITVGYQRRYPTLRNALNVVANNAHYNTISEEVES